MSDLKSKFPDLKELTSMGTKLYKGIKSSVEEIIHDYKEKRTTAVSKKKPTRSKPSKKSDDIK